MNKAKAHLKGIKEVEIEKALEDYDPNIKIATIHLFKWAKGITVAHQVYNQ